MNTPHPRKTDTLSRIEMDLLDPHFALSVVDTIGVRRFRVKELPLDRDALVRVKAVLRFPVDGIEESYFQLAERMEGLSVQPLVQFRMRAVSKEGMTSKWNYSNLVTSAGERVIFELLAEIAENIDWLNDKDIEFMLESFADDLYLERVLERQAVPMQDYGFREQMKKAIREQLVQAVDALTEFREAIRFTPHEVASLFKDYVARDTRIGRQDDFLTSVISSYLEDKLSFDLKEALGAYGEGEAPFAYAQDTFDFILRAEFLQEEWSPFARDHAFFVFRDFASLLSDPVVQEMMQVEKEETFMQTFLYALASMVGLNRDRMVLDLFHLVDDLYEVQPETPAILLEQDEIKIQLLYEVLSLVFEQTDQLLDVNPEIASHLMYRFHQKDQRVILHREEQEGLVQVRKEKIRQASTTKTPVQESTGATSIERIVRQRERRPSWHETQTSTIAERLVQVITDWRDWNEKMNLTILDQFEMRPSVDEKRQDEMPIVLGDDAKGVATPFVKAGDIATLRLSDRLIKSETMRSLIREVVQRKRRELHEIWLKMNPDTRGARLYLDRGTSQQYDHELYDQFEQGDYEYVQYALGEEYDGQSVGVKTIGEITL